MPRTSLLAPIFAVAILAACSSASDDGGTTPPAPAPEASVPDSSVPDAPPSDGAAGDGQSDADAGPACATPAECAAQWEKNASARYDAAMKNPADRAAFLKAVPKGGDLHNHLTGAVYAETFLGWSAAENGCINTTTFVAVFASGCSAATAPTPASGPFFDDIVRAWSMKDFVPGGAQTGRDHFFATFGKFGAIAGTHRDDDIADVLKRAASENQLYVETMFNLGQNMGDLAAPLFSGPMTPADLPAFYDAILADANFATELAKDIAVVNNAAQGYKTKLGCSGATPPAACKVGVRFIAQVARTGANDDIFGQMVSAFEMAAVNPNIVGVSLSSPEDDTRSLNNYGLHMAMLDFLYQKYTVTGLSPLKVSTHAGELVPAYLPVGHEDANTFHIRDAVQIAHASRIGHGLDILSETDSALLMDEMKAKNVLVEICLSSNDQILEVKGAAHPLAEYLKKGVPVTLATDDQGVSRSSMAGEYSRGALEQKLTYRQLKTMARESLEHAFLPGATMWTSVSDASAVPACARTATMGLGDPPSAGCKAFLDASERATMQWELERRFLAFEKTP